MQISLERDINEIDRIVAATRAYFQDQQLPDSLVPTVDLATEELFVNMVRHGQAGDARIVLEMAPTEGGVAVTLIDTSSDPFDPRNVPDVDTQAPLNKREPGGLGLYLVNLLVSDIDYEFRDGTSRVTFHARTGERDV
ncbi:ATP-binding protein [Halioglobus pacificus]|uniref:Histidine kinase/HSP90-like ATPase domain-containing protein n=1 Tax=Parahalioglobus pacificus TaxID=930806 RepID=A0A919CL64_9GAMM|nr:ATP-binding protein [Halioglobus pacificus]NQY01847.1 ATP-binding protein [Halieaceae bacterium]GHD36015.1 hypothetical protein GCM10007053_23790 [Halioglobus pacificus]